MRFCLWGYRTGSTIPSSSNDYAVVPKSAQLFRIIQSINNELSVVNAKIQERIGKLQNLYGDQVDQRDTQNYDLIAQNDKLEKERKRIQKKVDEYQSLENMQEQSNIFTTQYYTIYYIALAIAIVAIIVLAMSSIDQNTSNTLQTIVIKPSVQVAQTIARSVNPFYLMFGIIIVIVVAYLYNQYYYNLYNNMPSFKKMGQLGIVYFVFFIILIYVMMGYFSKNSSSSYLPKLPTMNMPTMNMPTMNIPNIVPNLK
jgi:hypothetical protein